MPNSEPEPVHTLGILTRKEAALLYNVLCDNAREWNTNLIKQLRAQVSDTDAYNARVYLTTGRWDG